MCYRTDNPLSDYNRYMSKQEKALSRLPVCSECGEHIQDDYCYVINDEYICEDCMIIYRKPIDDLIDY